MTSAQEEASVRELLHQASTRWLKNSEVDRVLAFAAGEGHRSIVASAPVKHPHSGLVAVYSKRDNRRFRRDGHVWKKKKDGKTVREDHERLKIDGREALTCCYAHSEVVLSFHRRIYWRLNDSSDLVLVHYLDVNGAAVGQVRSDSPHAVVVPLDDTAAMELPIQRPGKRPAEDTLEGAPCPQRRAPCLGEYNLLDFDPASCCADPDVSDTVSDASEESGTNWLLMEAPENPTSVLAGNYNEESFLMEFS
jgi:hypothetical protein